PATGGCCSEGLSNEGPGSLAHRAKPGGAHTPGRFAPRSLRSRMRSLRAASVSREPAALPLRVPFLRVPLMQQEAALAGQGLFRGACGETEAEEDEDGEGARELNRAETEVGRAEDVADDDGEQLRIRERPRLRLA